MEFLENQWVIGIGCGIIVGFFFLMINHKKRQYTGNINLSWKTQLWKFTCFSIIGSLLLILLIFVSVFVSEIIKQGFLM